MSESITILAPAKINLALAVGRVEGPTALHPICSWMVTVDLFDELLLTRLPAGRLSRYAILWHEEAKRRREIDWSITKDLAVQAHQAMERRLGRSLPVQSKLEKRIPVGGGLGGGSSNAAAMLRGLNELFELNLSVDEVAEIGAAIGSDVAFLVHGGSAIVEGFGEKIQRQDETPEFHAALVLPEASCPTGRVYGMFDEIMAADHALRGADVHALVRERSAAGLSEGSFNDLAAAAMRVAPSLRDDLARLEKIAERRAHVSGSGSSLFVICDDAMHAEHLAAGVEERLGLPAVAVRSGWEQVHKSSNPQVHSA